MIEEKELSLQDKIIINGVRTYILGYLQHLSADDLTEAILSNAYPILEIIDAEIPDFLMGAMPLIMQYKEKLVNMITFDEMVRLAKENRPDLAKVLNTKEGYAWSINFLKIVKFFIENIELSPPRRRAKFEEMINERRAIAANKQRAIQEKQEAEQRAREEQERMEQERVAQMQMEADARIAMEQQRLIEEQRMTELRLQESQMLAEAKARAEQAKFDQLRTPNIKPTFAKKKTSPSKPSVAQPPLEDEDDDARNRKPIKIDRNINGKYMSTF